MSLPPSAFGAARPTYGRAATGPVPVSRRVRAPVYGPGRGPTFIPRPPTAGGVGAGLGKKSGSLAGLISGLAIPLLCLGCLSTLAIMGLFATMIGATTYMNRLQGQIRKLATGAGTTIGIDYITLMFALVCSIYVLTKHRRGLAVSS